MKKYIVFPALLIACMQLEYVEISANSSSSEAEPEPESSSSEEYSSSSEEGPTLQMGEHELAYRGISYYDAILICNSLSRQEGLDTLYKYDKPVFTEDSLFWLPNIRVLENRSGYRLPTKEEWLAAEVEKLDKNVGEWLYSEGSSQYAVFELAPNFLKAVGLYRERAGYPVYGMRVVKTFSKL